MSAYRRTFARRCGRRARDLALHAKDNIAAADRVAARFERPIEELRDFPRLGPERGEISPGLRGIVAGQYVILYDVDDDQRQVTILRILHMARNLQKLFL